MTDFYDDLNLGRFQDNINSYGINSPESIDFKLNCYPFIYSHYDFSKLENGNKIILPKQILKDLSKYTEIEYPLHFSINDSNILFTPAEFKDDIIDIFIPKHFIDILGVQVASQIKLTFLNKKIPKGNKIKLKPHTSNFLDIMDHKHFLENHLTKLYTTLSLGQTILIPKGDITILIDILECSPSNTISIIDTDLEVEFEAPWDYIEKPINENEKMEEEETFESCKKQFKMGKFNFSNNKIKHI